MITKELTYQKAFELKKQVLAQKRQKREIMLASAYASNPRLSEIDNLLAAGGANLAITALSGDTQKIETIKKRSQALSEEKKLLLKKAQVPEISYDCPICNDSGYVGGKICECVSKLANSIMIKEFTEEMPLDECTFSNFSLDYYPDTDDIKRKMTSVFSFCKNYAEDFDPKKAESLLFIGDAGLGKTHLTLAIVGAVIKKGFMPVYGPAENLFSLVENEKFSGQNKGSYDMMINCDLLVIDDLGAEMATTFTKSVLYNLINTRMLSKKPTIINTNLSISEIEKIYSARIVSRLIGNYNAFRFLGNDIRQKKILEKQR